VKTITVQYLNVTKSTLILLYGYIMVFLSTLVCEVIIQFNDFFQGNVAWQRHISQHCLITIVCKPQETKYSIELFLLTQVFSKVQTFCEKLQNINSLH